jgi:hypothetical protein
MESNMTPDSCTALDRLRRDADALMADLLAAALAVKAEQGIADDAEAYDYTVSFLSGVYRAFALAVREPVIGMMRDGE